MATAACLLALSAHKPLLVANYGLLLNNMAWSLFASVWLYLVLGVITPGEVDIGEASLTLAFYLVFMCYSLLVDMYLRFEAPAATSMMSMLIARRQRGGGGGSGGDRRVVNANDEENDNDAEQTTAALLEPCKAQLIFS